MNPKTVGISALILVLVAIATTLAILLSRPDASGVAPLQLPKSNRFGLTFTSTDYDNTVNGSWSGELYFDGSLSIDQLQFSMQTTTGSDYLKLFYNKGKYVAVSASRYLSGVQSQCFNSKQMPNLAEATANIGSITQITSSQLITAFGGSNAQILLSKCGAGKFYHFTFAESEIAICLNAGLPVLIATQNSVVTITGFKAEGSFTDLAAAFPASGANCASILSEAPAAVQRVPSYLETGKAPFSSFASYDNPHHDFHATTPSSFFSSKHHDIFGNFAPAPKALSTCVFLHGLSVDNSLVNSIMTNIYWVPLTLRPSIRSLCARFETPVADTVNQDSRSTALQDQYYNAAIKASNNAVFAHSMANVILSRACLDQNKCVKWFGIMGPVQGSPDGEIMKNSCPTSTNGLNQDAAVGLLAYNLGMCSPACYGLATCGRAGSASVCTEAEYGTIRPYVLGNMCGNSPLGIASIASLPFQAIHTVFTSKSAGPNYIGNTADSDGVVPLHSCTRLTNVDPTNVSNYRSSPSSNNYIGALNHVDGIGALTGDLWMISSQRPEQWIINRLKSIA